MAGENPTTPVHICESTCGKAEKTSTLTHPSASGKLAALRGKIVHLVDVCQNYRLPRALSRYSTARGGLLAGGIAYSGLFSLAAAATIAWSIFMALLGSRAEIRESVIEAANAALPGFLDDGTNHGLINPSSLLLPSAFTVASAGAAIVLVWTATSMLTALASSIRSMFGLVALKENPIFRRLRAAGGFLIMGVGILASALTTILVGQLWDLLHLSGFLLRPLGYLSSFLIDGLVVFFLVRIVAHVRMLWRDAVLGCAIAAAGMTIIRIAGTAVVSSVGRNALLASFVAIATLLLWMNLWARVLLFACAFMANPPRQSEVPSAKAIRADERPNYVTLSAAHTLAWPHDPITGTIFPRSEGQLSHE